MTDHLQPTRSGGRRFEGLDRVMGGTGSRRLAAYRLATEAGEEEKFQAASHAMRDSKNFAQFLDATLEHFGRADLAGGIERLKADDAPARGSTSVKRTASTAAPERKEAAPAPVVAAKPAPAPYTPPAPSAAEIAAAKVRLQQEADAAKAADVQRRREAAVAVWDRAAKVNGYQLNDPLPSAKAIKADPTMSDEEKRRAAADAVWDRAHAANAQMTRHLR